jgi:hypothetical protein
MCENCGDVVGYDKVDEDGVCFGCCHETCAACGIVNHTSQMTEEMVGENSGLMVCCGCEEY